MNTYSTQPSVVYVGISLSVEDTVITCSQPNGAMQSVQLPTVLGYANNRWYIGEDALQQCDRPLHLLASVSWEHATYGPQNTPLQDCFAIYFEQVLQYAFRAGIGSVSYDGSYRITTQIGAISIPYTLPQISKQILIAACQMRHLGKPRINPAGTSMALRHCSRPHTQSGLYLFCHLDSVGSEITLADYDEELVEVYSSRFLTDFNEKRLSLVQKQEECSLLDAANRLIPDLLDAVQGVLNHMPGDRPFCQIILSGSYPTALINAVRWRLAAMLGMSPVIVDNPSVITSEGAAMMSDILHKTPQYLVLDTLRTTYTVLNAAGQRLITLEHDTTLPCRNTATFQADTEMLYLTELSPFSSYENKRIQTYSVPFTGQGVITLEAGADGFVHCTITKE